MNCPRCDKNIPDDAVLCCYCGKRIAQKVSFKRHSRGNGNGCAYKRGKTWMAIYTSGWEHTEDGKQRQLRQTKGGFRTKNEALAYCITLKNAGVKKCAPSLETYWLLYRDGECAKLSDSKQLSYKIAWDKLKALRFRPVDTLTVQDLRAVVTEKAPTFYPARDMKTLLKHLFRLAAADGFVNKDLPDFISLPDLETKERNPFTAEEQASLWRVYDAGDRRAAIPLIMIYTGMMPGEMQGLKLEMVDLEKQVIVGGSIKTKVRRASPIYLPDTIIPVLAKEMSFSTNKDGYVWPRNEVRFYRDYYAVLEAASCRRLEPYSCRHTTATALAITEGIAPQTIKKVMRWSTTKMLDTYVHPTDKDALAAVNRLSRAPDAASVKQPSTNSKSNCQVIEE